MSTENEGLKFPVEGASSCPNCGSTERLLEQILDKFRDEGKISKDAFPRGSMLQVQLIDPNKLMLATAVRIPVLLIFYDICAQCKTFYCKGVEVIEQAARMMPQRGFPPDFKGGRVKPF